MSLEVSFQLNSFHSYGRCYAPKENSNQSYLTVSPVRYNNDWLGKTSPLVQQ